MRYCDDCKAAPGRAGASGRGGARQALWIAVCGGGVRQVVMDRAVRGGATLAVLLLVVVLQHAEPPFRYGSRRVTGPTRHAGSSAAQPPEPSAIALPSETPGGWRKRHEPSRGLPRRQRWR